MRPDDDDPGSMAKRRSNQPDQISSDISTIRMPASR